MKEPSCPERTYDYAYANPVQVTNSLILILFYSFIYLLIYFFFLPFTVFSRGNWRWIHDDEITLLPRELVITLTQTLHKWQILFEILILFCSFNSLLIYLFSLPSTVLFCGNWYWICDDEWSFLPRENLWLRLRKSCRKDTSFFNLAEHKNGVRSRWCLC